MQTRKKNHHHEFAQLLFEFSLKKEKLIVFCTSTDCTSFIVSFTGPVTSATEIAFAIFKRLLLLLLLVLDFFLNFKVVGEEMNALVVDIVMDTILLFVFFYSLVFF